MAKRKRFLLTPLRVAIGVAVLTTAFGLVASAMNAITEGGTYEVGLHNFAMVLNLGAYSVLIFAIIASRKKPVQSLAIEESGEFLSIEPCDSAQVIVFDQKSVNELTKGFIRKLPFQVRYEMRVVVARSLALTSAFSDSLNLFPNLAVLDLQCSEVPEKLWEELETLDSLTHVLVHQAIQQSEMRHLTVSLPEIRFWTNPMKLAISKKTAT